MRSVWAVDQVAVVRRELEAVVAGFDGTRLTGDEAVGLVRELGMVRNLVDALAGLAAARIEETVAYRRACDRSTADTLAKALGIGPGEARRLKETAEKLPAHPGVDSEVRAGRLPARDAHLIAEALTVAPEAEQRLLSAAREGHQALREECVKVRAEREDAGERARRQHAARSLRMWTDHDGMVAGAFRLTPEVGGPIRKWVDAAVEKVFRTRRPGEEHEPHEAYAADVLAALFDGSRGTGDAPGGEQGAAPSDVVEVDAGAGRKASIRRGADVRVHVLVDYDVLVRGEVRDGRTCEIAGVGPVSYEWVRSLLGEAFLTAVIKKGVDITTVAHLGRHVPAELRTALIVSGRECDIEGCEVSGYLELDHEHDFAKGGPTSWRNLGWLCAVHHRMKTAGWRLGPRDPVTRKRTLHPPHGVRRRPDAA